MVYRCITCNKIYSSYQSLWNHNKKFHNNLTSERLHMTSNDFNLTSNDFNLTSNDFNTKIINKYLCQYCNNEFTRKNNLNYHIKNRCKEKIKKDKEENIYKQQIEKLTNDLEKLKNKSNNKIITYNTLTNNNLTNINNIGNEKISDLTRDEKKYIMSHGMNSIISLAEHLNFNEKLPNNHNFYVSALNDKHLNTIDDKTKTIIKEQKKNIFDRLLFAHIEKLEKINKNINYKDFDTVLTKLKNIIFLKQMRKQYFDQLNMLAYNKRNLIIKTWKELINDDTISADEIANTFQERINEITNNDTDSDSGDETETDSESDYDLYNINNVKK